MAKGRVNKVLIGIGVLLLLVPFVAFIVLSIIRSINEGAFIVDYLIYIRLFPIVAIGSYFLLDNRYKYLNPVSNISDKKISYYKFFFKIVTLVIVLSFLLINILPFVTGTDISIGWGYNIMTNVFIVVYILASIVQLVVGAKLFFELINKGEQFYG